jgi:hypothetical protein
MRLINKNKTVGAILAVSALFSGAYPVWAACNGQVTVPADTSVGGAAPNCTQVVTHNLDCASPTPADPKVHCVRVIGTVSVTTYSGTLVENTRTYCKCGDTFGHSCAHCVMPATGVVGTGSGYTTDTTCPGS